MNYLFSIITPTFNRVKELPILFQSLKKQSGIKFEWIVVDDGSSDGTSEKINEFMRESSDIFDIKYIYQSNQGKNSAVIKGIKESNGDFIAIIDSDDYLYDNAFICVKKYIFGETFSHAPELIGISGVKVDADLNPVSFISDQSAIKMTHYDWFYKYCRLGDRIDFYKSSILKSKVFNSFSKEKFITEDALWLDIEGEKLFVNEPLLIVKYMNDGLSSGYSSLLKENPFGTVYYYYILLINSPSIKIKIKSSLLMIYYILLTIKKNSNVFVALLTFILSPLLCLIKFLRK